eukprot:3457055-Pleurochrysis_carterae.AAC.1
MDAMRTAFSAPESACHLLGATAALRALLFARARAGAFGAKGHPDGIGLYDQRGELAGGRRDGAARNAAGSSTRHVPESETESWREGGEKEREEVCVCVRERGRVSGACPLWECVTSGYGMEWISAARRAPPCKVQGLEASSQARDWSGLFGREYTPHVK